MSEARGQPPRAPARSPALAVPQKAFDGLALYAFVALGLPDGMIGTAWPALRQSFGAPLGDLGVVLLVGTLGALASSLAAGSCLGWLGLRGTIMLGGAVGGLGATGVVVSPSFWAFAFSYVAVGMAAGLLDGAVNTAAALAGRNRLLNLLHGCYGAGSTAGPLLVTAALLAGSWRPAYAAMLVVELALVAGWWLAGRAGHRGPGNPGTAGLEAFSTGAAAVEGGSSGLEEEPGPVRGPRPRPWPLPLVVGLGIVVFMVYVGFEVGAGQWEPSFDRGPLHLGTGATGVATFGYWGALTAVRFALAAPRRPLPPGVIVRWGCALAVGGAALVCWRPDPLVALLGLVLIGGALAGVFPALVTLTPLRVGGKRAQHVIGWQIGAAAVGGSGISALFGAAFQHWGLADFGPALLTVGALLLAGVLALERVPRHHAGPWS